jgi:hypothetical protein
MAMGTVVYMAPGGRTALAWAAVDVYALGVCLLEALAGQVLCDELIGLP